MNKNFSKTILILLCIFILLSCEDKVSSPTNKLAILASNTYLIKDNIVNISATKVTLGKDSPASKAEVGDILLCGSTYLQPEGVLRKITGKSTESEIVAFETIQSSLVEAFAKLSLQSSLALTPDKLVEFELFNNCIYEPQPNSSAYNFVFNTAILDRDDNDDKITIEGNLQLTFETLLDIQIDNNILNKFEINNKITKIGKLNIIAKDINDLGDERVLKVASLRFYPQTILINNLPLVITPILDLTLHLAGNYDLSLTAEITIEETSNSGVSYHNDGWQIIDSAHKELTSSIGDIPLEYNIRFGFSAAANYLLYGSNLASIATCNDFKFTNDLHFDGENHELQNSSQASLNISSTLKAELIAPQFTTLDLTAESYSEVINPQTAEYNDLTSMVFLEGGRFYYYHDLRDEAKTPLIPPFYMSKYQVTQAQFEKVMGYNPSTFIGWNKPVETVSWYEAIKYCNLLSLAEGYVPYYQHYSLGNDPNNWPSDYDATYEDNGIRISGNGTGYCLPTSLKWRYAADQTLWYSTLLYSGSNDCDSVAHYSGNNEPYGTKPVGMKKPNELGIYDLTGNVWEMLWPDNYPLDKGEERLLRVVRGGSWRSSAEECHIRHAEYIDDNNQRLNDVGFRICRNNDESTAYHVMEPVIRPFQQSHFFSSPLSITITVATPGANIRYTTDGTLPTQESLLFESPLLLETTTEIRAKAFRENWFPSHDVYKRYNYYKMVPPVLHLPAGTYYGNQSLEITCATPFTSIKYLKNGPYHTFEYYSPINIHQDVTIYAWAEGYENGQITRSDTVSAHYTIIQDSPPKPTLPD